MILIGVDDWLNLGENNISDERVSNIIETVREERKKPSISKVIIPLQMVVIFFLVAGIGALIYKFKAIELIIIVILMFALFFVVVILVLSGSMGFQLALLKIPSLRKYAGDMWEIGFENSGRCPIRISKFKNFMHFGEGEDIAKVTASKFYEPSTGLPIQVGVQGFPLTVDPREQFSQEPLVKIKNQLSAVGSLMISIFHLGKLEGNKRVDKLFKYLQYCLWGIIIIGILSVASFYFNYQISEFFKAHGKEIIDTITTAKTAAQQVITELGASGKTALIPNG